MSKLPTTEGVEPIDLSSIENPPPAPEAPAPEAQPAPDPEPSPDPASLSMEEADEAFENTFLKQLESADEDVPKETNKTEPEPEPEPSAEESSDSPAAANFKKVKQSRDNAISERDALKAELDELKSRLGEMENSDVNELMAKLTNERDTLSQQLKVASLERHPEFQQKFEKRIQQIVASTKSTVGEEYAERMGELIQMSDSAYRNQALEEIMSELTQTQQARMGALLTRMDEVRSDRDTALKDADATYAQMMEQRSAEQVAAQERDDKIFNQVSGRFQEAYEVFQPREGDEGWNNEVNDRLSVAKQIFSGQGNSAEDLIEASHWAAAGPKYRELLIAQMEINKRLRSENKDLTGATPTASTSETPSDSASDQGFEEKFAEMTGWDISSPH